MRKRQITDERLGFEQKPGPELISVEFRLSIAVQAFHYCSLVFRICKKSAEPFMPYMEFVPKIEQG